VTLSDRDRKLIIATVPILLLAAYWFLLLAPKRDEASSAATELTKQEQRLDAARGAADAAKGAKSNFTADYTEIVRLGKAIPAQLDMPSVVVQLDAAAAGTGIHFTKIATGDREPAAATTTSSGNTGSESGQSGAPVAAGGQTAQSGPGAAAESANNAQQTANQQSSAAEQSGVSSTDTQTSTSAGSGLPVGGGSASSGASTAATGTAAGLETVPLELEFVGNFFNLADFFHRVKRFVRVANQNVVVSGRLITVDSVRWSSDSEIFPKIRAELTATIYLSPQSQGTSAGATPAGPTTGTTAAGTSSPSTGAPTATATP
jgi:Tfp pilus assembly protein PilO